MSTVNLFISMHRYSALQTLYMKHCNDCNHWEQCANFVAADNFISILLEDILLALTTFALLSFALSLDGLCKFWH